MRLINNRSIVELTVIKGVAIWAIVELIVKKGVAIWAILPPMLDCFLDQIYIWYLMSFQSNFHRSLMISIWNCRMKEIF